MSKEKVLQERGQDALVYAGELEIYRNTDEGGIYERPVFPPVWCMLEQARQFIRAVRGEIPNVSPAADAVKDLEIAETVIRESPGCQAM